MKLMKNTMKCFVAVFMMVMAFAVTGITAEAAEAAIVKDLANVPTPVIYTVNFAAGQTEALDTVNIPSKGSILISAAANTSTNIEFYNGATRVGYPMYLPATAETCDDVFEFSGPTTATIKLTRSSYAADTEGMVQFFMLFVNSGDASVSAKETTAYYSQNYTENSYTKISVNKTGYICVETPSTQYSSVYVTLCNKSKKAVSEEIYVSSSSPYTYFAVSKGTYYIKTRASSDGMYNVRYTFTKVSEKSGSKKAKAVNIKKNKTIKGVLTANNKSQADWYKVKLTKKQVLKITYKSLNTGGYGDIKLQVIPANKNMKIYGDTVKLANGTSGTAKSTGKWSAGTYYLKVTKGDKKASGYYQIKWK